ncbi:alpha/beta fold hydrolase [Frigidibacter sp. ROC022]|uniref:alpha/beta fold hydrolase n=1 Tax=Frigidibacter sp. ROC022 TaxID=2971796 RepID=UPI00215A775A|nr:alpha/beta hydrolase [Frigidibacter sp. ROC022]MCR8723053.1 alpha/beta hydrolase [Frigidibacter sp. ROC022]
MPEPLVLIAGPLMDARIFLPQMIGLGDALPMLLPRRVNPGTIEAMAEAMLAEAPPRFALLGHGSGGMVAMEALRRAPERITRLVLIATDALPDPAAVSVARENAVVQARAGKYEAVLERDAAIVDYAGRGDCDDLAGLLRDMALAAGPEAFATQTRALQRRPDQQRTLRQTKLPALLIAGGADPLYRARRMELMSGLMADSRLEIAAGAGHLVTLEAPDLVNAALRRFLLPEPVSSPP